MLSAYPQPLLSGLWILHVLCVMWFWVASQSNTSVWYLDSNAYFPTLMFLDICMFSFVFSNSWWLYMSWCVTAYVFLVDWRKNWWSANGWSRNESCHKCAPWLIRVIWSSGEGRTSTGFVLYHFWVCFFFGSQSSMHITICWL